eukprot:TRINITY_DN17022_c0_g1_i1.p1 TRINITY_DN17022_c0_g1~~TRINITY_DN17022_c0_g1_i1.p1  ORF type:complete len:227 (+),score=70.58 TRINITY_DN17022_c0_g1_i1:48-728(+)
MARWTAWCGAVVAVAAVLACVVSATDYGQESEADLLEKDSYKNGDTSLVYVYVQLNNHTAPIRTKYFPKIDEFSMLEILNSSRWMKNKNVQVWLAWGNKFVTTKKHFSDGKRFVGSWSAVVNFKKGKPQEIVWAGSCDECTPQLCVDDACTVKDPGDCHDPKELKKDPGRCGMKIYLAFYGEDKQGHTMTSDGSLPERFQKYSFTMKMYEAAAGFWDDWAPDWKAI